MLHTTRCPGQELVLGPKSIRVVVLGVHGGRVKLGIEAPRDVAILRQEVGPVLAAGSPPKGN
jgi:carbon storage regulator